MNLSLSRKNIRSSMTNINSFLKHGPIGWHISTAMLQHPRPLIAGKQRLVLSFSAKGGCTFAVKWMFSQMNFLDEALAYNSWIHRYRLQVYYHTPEYAESLAEFMRDPGSFIVIRVTRNPFERAVSSYVQANVVGDADRGLRRYLQRPIDADNRFTFREFVGFLETIDLTSCNSHHKLQTNAIDNVAKRYQLPFEHVPLEDFAEHLDRITRKYQLKQVDLDPLLQSVHHSTRNPKMSESFWGDHIFSIYGRRDGNLPPTAAFYDDSLRSRVAKLYAVDLNNFYPELAAGH